MSEIEELRRELRRTQGFVMYLVGALAAQMKDRVDRELVTARTRELAAWAHHHLLDGNQDQDISMGVAALTVYLRDPKNLDPMLPGSSQASSGASQPPEGSPE